MKLALALCLLLLCTTEASALEPSFAVVREIRFEGNDTTQPRTMLREMVIHVGDPADPRQIERSRQAIQDLGLFHSVAVREEILPDGVRLVFVVVEKFYLLPYPRLSGNVDGQYGYGGELEWNNIAGLNQGLRLLVKQSSPNREGYGKQLSYQGSYTAPFVFDSPYSVSVSANHSRQPLVDPVTQLPYIERFTSWELDGSRTYSTGPASEGWTAGGGWLSTHENRNGPGAAPPYGAANAVVGFVGYRDLHDLIYSEEGQNFNLRSEVALRGLASDYGYTFLNAAYDRYLPVGHVDYQTVQLTAQAGALYNGPAELSRFSLGGSGNLRSFPSYSFSGNAYYYLAALYQRPIGEPWLRGLIGVEGGNVSPQANTALFRAMHMSLDIGVRLRVTWFVDFQFEAGWAVPLNGRGAGRFFGGRI